MNYSEFDFLYYDERYFCAHFDGTQFSISTTEIEIT